MKPKIINLNMKLLKLLLLYTHINKHALLHDAICLYVS